MRIWSPARGRRGRAPPVVGTLLACGAIAAAWSVGCDDQAASQAGAGTRKTALTIAGPTEPIVAVTSSWSTEVPRALSVVLTEAATCGESVAGALQLARNSHVVVDAVAVADTGSRADEVTITITGSYLLCGYLQPSADPAGPADLVVRSPRRVEITTFPRLAERRGTLCGDVGGPRHITRVRAHNVICRAARRLARRWGRSETAPRVLGDYSCRRRARVICAAAASRKVTFQAGPRDSRR